jgi:hypothetical protein
MGIRKGEVLGLVWYDINLDAEELTMGRCFAATRFLGG